MLRTVDLDYTDGEDPMAAIVKGPALVLASMESTSGFQHRQVIQNLPHQASTWARIRQGNPEDH